MVTGRTGEFYNEWREEQEVFSRKNDFCLCALVPLCEISKYRIEDCFSIKTAPRFFEIELLQEKETFIKYTFASLSRVLIL